MILTDDNKDPKRLPTKANILDAMKWLVKDAKAHDSLFFHCGWTVRPFASVSSFLQTLVTAGRSAVQAGMKPKGTTMVS